MIGELIDRIPEALQLLFGLVLCYSSLSIVSSLNRIAIEVRTNRRVSEQALEALEAIAYGLEDDEHAN